jgi:hypothetical protein
MALDVFQLILVNHISIVLYIPLQSLPGGCKLGECPMGKYTLWASVR